MRKIISMKRQAITSILIILFFTSCEVKNRDNSIEQYVTNSIRTNENNIPLDSNQFYFPVHLFRDTNVRINNDTFTVAWYSKHLRAMKEPLLFNRKEKKEVFRFTWLRNFDNPVVIRIEKLNDKCKLIWKLCDGDGGYEPGNMIISEEKVISKRTWNHFVHLINKTRFWEMETVEKEPTGLDGEQWILEGKNENSYHVVDRWSPNFGNYFNCCSYLIQSITIDSSKLEKFVFNADSSKKTDYGKVYILVEEYPIFGNDREDLSKYIAENIKSYLPSNVDSSYRRVFVSFVIFEDGSIQNIKIEKGVRSDIDSACIKLFKEMPNWTPGKIRGKPVKVQTATFVHLRNI